MPDASVDLLFSQAVLEDMAHEPGQDVLEETFMAMAAWVKPGGVMSHQIDLAGPFGKAWNDHWTVGETAWRVTRGRRPYDVNRVPLSECLALCARHGVDVLRATTRGEELRRGRDEVARRFRALPDEDSHTSAVHLVARRR